jgi:hypothetical protein
MVFAKRLREGVVRGDITCSVRIWTGPHVTEGRRYRMGDGEIEIESVTPIGFPDITPELARESGFLGVLDLLKVAKHGKGNNIYLIRFHYIPPHRKKIRPRHEPRPAQSSELRLDHLLRMQLAYAVAKTREHARGLAIKRYAPA